MEYTPAPASLRSRTVFFKQRCAAQLQLRAGSIRDIGNSRDHRGQFLLAVAFDAGDADDFACGDVQSGDVENAGDGDVEQTKRGICFSVS